MYIYTFEFASGREREIEMEQEKAHCLLILAYMPIAGMLFTGHFISSWIK